MNTKQKFVAYINFLLTHLNYSQIQQIIKDKGYKLNCDIKDFDNRYICEKDLILTNNL